MPAKRTHSQFLLEARNVWGDKWDYSNTVYVGSGKSIEISCNQHGTTCTQRASSHLKGEVPCPQCRGVVKDSSSFVRAAKEVWGDRWDYSCSEYITSRISITINCPNHGTYRQSPAYHLQGKVGCKKCSGQQITPEEFIGKSREVWGDRWDYSPTVYHNWATPVILRCPEHGEFQQSASSHLRGSVGCSPCSGRVLSIQDFISQSIEVWGDRWDYSTTAYSGSKNHLTIICKEHGPFRQVPTSHLRGSLGCKSCAGTSSSRGEESLYLFVKSLGVEVERGRRGLLENPHLELDIYLPKLKLAIEFNGLYYHSEYHKTSEYHHLKWEMCSSQGIRLIQIWEDWWENSPEKVMELIRRATQTSVQPKISARNCSIGVIGKHDAYTFMEKNHIQGGKYGSIQVGLRTKNEGLVAVGVFTRRGNILTLDRYATSALVRGGHSKIVSFVEKTETFEKMITFADLTLSEGSLYEHTGWDRDGYISPDYYYFKGNSRYHKFNFRKAKFKASPSLEYAPGLTESELASLNNYARIYDAGKLKYTRLNRYFNDNGEDR